MVEEAGSAYRITEKERCFEHNFILLASVSVANYNHQPVNKDNIGIILIVLENFGWGGMIALG
jgi:hypothetical protein